MGGMDKQSDRPRNRRVGPDKRSGGKLTLKNQKLFVELKWEKRYQLNKRQSFQIHESKGAG